MARVSATFKIVSSATKQMYGLHGGCEYTTSFEMCRRAKGGRGQRLCLGGCPTPPCLKGLIPVQTGYNNKITGTAFFNAVVGKNHKECPSQFR
jgi:hypothetical protein